MTGKRLIITAAVLALLLPLLAGCGRIDINLHTTVRPSGDINQEVSFTGSGLMASFFDSAELAKDLQAEGWEVSVTHGSDSTTLSVSREFSADEVLAIPDLSGDPDALDDYSFGVQNYFFFTDYVLKVTIPGNPVDVTTDEFGDLGDFDDIAGQLLEGLFGMSWIITLPGEIVESNADSIQGSSATWVFDIGSLDAAQDISVRSRLVNWPIIAGASAGLAVLAAVVFFLVLKRRAAPTA